MEYVTQKEPEKIAAAFGPTVLAFLDHLTLCHPSDSPKKHIWLCHFLHKAIQWL